MLALGGGVTVAADQAKPGDALYSYKTSVNDNVRHEYHAIKASLTGQAGADENASFNSDTHLSGDESADDSGAAGGESTSVELHGALRVRDDASTSTKDLDNEVEGDGAVHVNIY